MSERADDAEGPSASRRLTLRLRRALGVAESLIFPASCGGCGTRGQWLCAGCQTTLQTAPQPSCRCGRPMSRGSGIGTQRACPACRDWPDGLRSIQAAYLFDGALRSSIHRFKYRGERARGDFLGELLAAYVTSAIDTWDRPFDLILPIPLHRRRERERGFNQAEVLARAVAAELQVPLANHLRRIVETRSQVGLDAAQRRANVREAFACTPGVVTGLAVLMVDDVVTTGATLEAAARATLGAGARRVDGIALARQTSAKAGMSGQE